MLGASAKSTNILSALPDRLSSRLFARATARHLGAGETLFNIGDEGNGCYRLDRGVLRVNIISEHGETLTLAVVGAGSIVGELALIDGRPRSASIIAVKDCELSFISRAHFEECVRHPEISRYLLNVLAARSHRQIAEQLQRVERNEVDRLMLLVPPRHGKSELASRRFPAWYLGRHPDRQFISACASATLAEDFGRDVRNLIASPEYAQIFETRLSEDSQAKGRWMTSEGGSYFATGVGGALMGRGAHILLIDDPFGSMADARSEQQRKAVHEWFTGTCYNRLEKDGKIILINHRMHQDDLSGRLLAQQGAGGDRWEVVELKALSPDGSALWPEKFDAAALARIKANTTAKDWAALYQQQPTAEEGTYFKEEWLFPYVGDPPPFLNVYGGSDFAVTSDGGDWTVHVVVGIDPQRRMYLLDLWRQQSSSKVWIEAYCDLVTKYKPMWWAFETGQIVAGLEPFIRQCSIERRAYTNTERFPTKGDKAIRCQSIRGRMELQGLYVPAASKWLPDLRAELTAFPDGKHDDQVDALGLVGQLMDRYVPGIVKKKPDNEKWPGCTFRVKKSAVESPVS